VAGCAADTGYTCESNSLEVAIMNRSIRNLCVVSAWLTCTAATGVADERPNVVFMLADNLGFGDVSAYNLGVRGGFQTPNIDRLAAEGLQLTQFLVEPTCTASRAGLMTGRYSIRSGLSWFPDVEPNTLQDDEFTLGELFSAAGYGTSYVGKWHLGRSLQSQPQNQGFDEWRVGFFGSTDGVLYPEAMAAFGAPEELQEVAKYWIVEADGSGDVQTIRQYDLDYRKEIDADMTDAAVDIIARKAQEEDPFFLFIGFSRPHYPNVVGEDFDGRSGAGSYADSVVELDHHVGEIIAAVREADIEDETIIVFASDNGPTTTTGSIGELYAGDPGPFRGELGEPYEGSLRTPAMVRWPGRIEPGKSSEMISIHDFLPTFAAMLGEALPDDRPIDGVDQSGFLLGSSETSSREHLLTFLGDRLIAVRWKQWRIYPVEFQPAAGNPELAGYQSVVRELIYPQVFNIEADPKEQVNLSSHDGAWVQWPYWELVEAYKESTVQYPNPPAVNLTVIRD
jgi:arylsulfatase A-like enzyme